MNELPELLIGRRQAVLWITLNRPEALNALTRGMLKNLRQALREVAQDTSCRAVVLTGAGRGFCVGADLSKFKQENAGGPPSFRQELETNFTPSPA